MIVFKYLPNLVLGSLSINIAGRESILHPSLHEWEIKYQFHDQLWSLKDKTMIQREHHMDLTTRTWQWTRIKGFYWLNNTWYKLGLRWNWSTYRSYLASAKLKGGAFETSIYIILWNFNKVQLFIKFHQLRLLKTFTN